MREPARTETGSRIGPISSARAASRRRRIDRRRGPVDRDQRILRVSVSLWFDHGCAEDRL